MSTEEDAAPVPNWMVKLEEQREKRLKARLGHEAGAGAPCQKCGDKCPGLDLHFWRKICKLCKCGKEDHDISDDDIYGFVQFQLLGSKPVKSKGVFLKGAKDEVILEWTPKGASNDVKTYLDELPADMVPVKGSEAAKIRKQRLQKQMPAHDIDATLCHALSPEEIKELEEYVAHIRKHSVGQGKIIRLSLLKGLQHKLGNPNAQFLSQHALTQVASSQTVYLQSSDLANNLHNLSLRDKPLSNTQSRSALLNSQISSDQVEQNPVPAPIPQDLIYPVSNTESINRFDTTNLKMKQDFLNYAPQSIHQIVDNQNPVDLTTKFSDLKYPNSSLNQNKNPGLNVQYPNQAIVPSAYDVQPTVLNPTSNTIQYPLTTTNVERHQEQYDNPNSVLNYELNNANVDRVLNPHLNFAPNFINQVEQHQTPTAMGKTKDLIYPNNQLEVGTTGNTNMAVNKPSVETVSNPTCYNPNYINPIEQHQLPTQLGAIKDLKYPSNFNANVNPNLKFNPNEQNTVPYPIGDGGYQMNSANFKQTDPNSVPSKFDNSPLGPNYSRGFPGSNTNLDNQKVLDQNYPHDVKSQDLKHRPEIPVLQAQNAINPFESQQNLMSVGYIRDIDYPIESNQEIPPQLPSSDPFDLVNSNSAVIPSCHECKKVFEDGAIAVTADRSSNLWHSSCFNCHSCKQPLADLLYLYHKDTDNIYCGRDYAILKGLPRCAACDELIFVREYCLAEDSTFHVKHFCCFECDEPLAGKQYVMENNQPVCVTCFENLKAEKCQDCGYVIRPDQQGVSLQDLHWHADPSCFCCKQCRKSMLGNKIMLRQKNLFCSDVCFKAYV